MRTRRGSTTARLGTSVAMLLLAVTACSADPDRSPQGSTDDGPAAVAAHRGPAGIARVTLHATSEFRFAPAVITAGTGRLRVTLVDDSAYPHNFSLPGLHRTSDTVTGGLGNDRTSIVVNLTRPGTYDFLCTYHASAGMRGQITVQ